ncbi:MAG: hypothetical protein L0Y79_09460 [Chlorobi bacterium]|nr:hypothetical protein [Chlorobiota bacterium]MCI0716142.1 hypothetical protein [Chlorobiota bacterium]
MKKTRNLTNREIREALKRSGYLIEQRVSNLLRKKEWICIANAVYPDPKTLITRELDIYAKNFVLLGDTNHDLRVTLVIECINNLYPLAFIRGDYEESHEYVNLVEVTGIPLEINYEGRTLSLGNFIGIRDFHHYYSQNIFKQYCTFDKKGNKPELMAIHYNDHIETFNKLSSSLTYYINQHYETILPLYEGRKNFELEFYYPIIIVQNKLLEIVNKVRGFILKNTNHVVFAKSIFENGLNYITTYDIITEKYFHKFLELVQKEMIEVSKRILDNINHFEDSFVKKAEELNRYTNLQVLKHLNDKNHFPSSPFRIGV